MKITNHLAAGLVCAGLLVTATAQDAVKFEVPGVTTPAKPATPAASTPAAPARPAAAPTPVPAPAAVKYTEAQLMEAYGYIFVLESRMATQLQAWEISPALKEAMLRGIGAALTGKDLTYDPQQIQTQLQEFLGKRQTAFLGKLRQAQLAAGAEHFTKLKANKNVLELPSGLRYEVILAGKGAVAKPGQQVTIHYTGALAGGQVFDSSVQRGEPEELILAAATAENPQGVIPGMFEGLQKTGVGGKLRLHIPPSLAYGDDGAPGAIPPGATLIFDIEIIAVKDAPKKAATN